MMRAVAEFERQESVLLIWPAARFSIEDYNMDNVSLEIVRHLLGRVQVFISVYDENHRSHVIALLEKNNIDPSAVHIVEYPSYIPFPRDFGADVMVDSKEGTRGFTHFRFDAYGLFPGANGTIWPELQGFSAFHAAAIDIPLLQISTLVSEGGDREFNGQGVMMTIEETEVTKRNPALTRAEVEEEFKRVFNLQKVIWLPQGTYDDENFFCGPIPGPEGKIAYRSSSANGHIDEMCRFVAHDTVLLAEVTEQEAASDELHAKNRNRLEAAHDVLKTETTADGQPLKIIRMPVPEPLYITINKQDYAYEDWKTGREYFHGVMMDGSPFPEPPFLALPALSYCNFLITNGLVIAHKYYREGMPLRIKQKDEEALNILKSVFPDREIVAVDVLPLNILGGGIHCHTKNVPALH